VQRDIDCYHGVRMIQIQGPLLWYMVSICDAVPCLLRRTRPAVGSGHALWYGTERWKLLHAAVLQLRPLAADINPLTAADAMQQFMRVSQLEISSTELKYIYIYIYVCVCVCVGAEYGPDTNQ
jgi:hypothetical protein